ncbi:helix-turn-helix domain-containing protein [Nitrospira sp. MA-1]|nr:helix-turn-helix domain-containing protein [Nitrospira sp. MA-1]
MGENLLTVKQAASILGLQESTVRKWVLSRRVGVVRLGRSVRLRRDEVETMIERNYISPVVVQKG